jgi:hypothetical protein
LRILISFSPANRLRVTAVRAPSPVLSVLIYPHLERQVQVVQLRYDRQGGRNPCEPFIIRRDHVPGSILVCCVLNGLLVSVLVLLPVAASFTSAIENFQFFSEFASRARKRFSAPFLKDAEKFQYHETRRVIRRLVLQLLHSCNRGSGEFILIPMQVGGHGSITATKNLAYRSATTPNYFKRMPALSRLR